MPDTDWKPLKGKFCKAIIPGINFAGVNWTLNADPKLDDCSNFLVGRFKEATLDDATVTCTIVESDPPQCLGTLKPGDRGILQLYTASDLSTWIEMPFIVGAFSPKVDDQEKVLRIEVTLAFSAYFDTGTSTWIKEITWQQSAP